jgi:hypothetical protein
MHEIEVKVKLITLVRLLARVRRYSKRRARGQTSQGQINHRLLNHRANQWNT